MSTSIQNSNWDPTSPQSWASALGLVYVPMFGNERASNLDGIHSVLLDGYRGSFALSSCNDEVVFNQQPLEWSWSSNMRHTVFVTGKRVVLKRWDSPDYTPSKPLPSSPAGAFQLLTEMEIARTNRLPDVISRMLKAFRAIRLALTECTTNTTDAVRVFNAFLLGSEQARLGRIDIDAWKHCTTIGQTLSMVSSQQSYGFTREIERASVGSLLDFFISPDPATKYVLEPDLLIRHAAGQLYQEAHFEIEREAIKQLSLPGLAGDEIYKGVAKRDARFTPPSLARTIVQQAFEAHITSGSSHQPLRILDPACGSGIFLQEAMRELLSRKYRGRVILQGFDTSEVSCVITRFCLEQVAHDARVAGVEVEIVVEQRNALSIEWGKQDFILMNPPFMNLQRMDVSERNIVKSILGPLASGHTDLAMAFLWRASQSLNTGGVLGSILPSSLLNSSGASKLREALLKEMRLTLIGHFKGYNYFPGAMVEPGFVVLKQITTSLSNQMITMLTAQEGAEDRALRLLRRGEEELSATQGVEILHESESNFNMTQWLPRSRAEVELLRRLTEANTPRVNDLFNVHLGASTGKNQVFVLSQQQYDDLPKAEHAYFRPLAGTKTINAGRIVSGQYIFFPYNDTGLILTSEVKLQSAVQQYYTKYLHPLKTELQTRTRINTGEWWRLTLERSWQRISLPKIVTKYFGNSGSFAYDATGEYIVGQGFGWLWRAAQVDEHSDEEYSEDSITQDTLTDAFYDSNLPHAYLALLNSPVFERLLAMTCPSMNGGQFNLSIRFVNTIHLPDLSDSNIMPSEVVEQLALLGRDIAQGRPVSRQTLSATSARAYGIPLPEWTF